MAADMNLVVIRGSIIRSDVKTFQGGGKTTQLAIAGEYEETGNDGKLRTMAFYQQVEVRAKEGEEAARLAIGTPVLAEGSLHFQEWTKENGDKGRRTYVRARTVRAIHGTEEDAFGQDAQGNLRLKKGFCHFWGTVNVTRDPDWRPVGQGGMVGNIGVACGDSWMVVEDGVGVWKEHTNWLRLTAWHEQAFLLQEVGLCKGASLFVHAKIENGSYDDSKTGNKVYTTDLNVLYATPRGRRGEAWAMTFPPKSAGGSAPIGEADLDGMLAFDEDLDLEPALPF